MVRSVRREAGSSIAVGGVRLVRGGVRREGKGGGCTFLGDSFGRDA